MDDVPQAERERRDDRHSRSVAETPAQSNRPRPATRLERERRERGQVIGAGEDVEETGKEAREARSDHGR